MCSLSFYPGEKENLYRRHPQKLLPLSSNVNPQKLANYYNLSPLPLSPSPPLPLSLSPSLPLSLSPSLPLPLVVDST